MSTIIVIILCALLLVAYLFDLTAGKTKIPAVILLLVLGWTVRQLTDFMGIVFPDFFPVLGVLGTIGLILIVLEGSLELELNKSKKKVIIKSLAGSLFSLVALTAILTYLFHYFGGEPIKKCLVNAIPLSVISSAIAIPSARHLPGAEKEFVIYESSFSDIIGVLFFNFIAYNEIINAASFGKFGMQLMIILIVSFTATLLLSFLLSRIEHHIKFVPIIVLVILIYEGSKVAHLPGLVFILLFGLFIGNIDELKNVRWLKYFHTEALNSEVKKFKELTIEGTFLVRALFFMLFGFLLENDEILNSTTFVWAIAIVILIFLIRIIQLRLSKLSLRPLLFIAPRGLITILLFLSIAPEQLIFPVNNSLVVQVVVLTALVMMSGLITSRKKAE